MSDGKVLLTAFEPFGGSDFNTSQMIVDHIANNEASYIDCALLPTSYSKAPEMLDKLCSLNEYRGIVSLGESAKAQKICLEKVALNLADFDIADNDGQILIDRAIDPNGPAAYFSRLPLRSMVEHLTIQGQDAEISLSAGAYVCNRTFYHLEHCLAAKHSFVSFIHVPKRQDLVVSIANSLQVLLKWMLSKGNI